MLLSAALWNFRTKQWGFLWTAYKSRNTLGIQGKNEWWSWLIPAMSGKWAQYSQVSSWQMHKGKMARLKSVLWENALGTSDHCGKNWGQADKDMRTHLVTSALTPPYQSHNFMLPHQGWHQNHLRKRQRKRARHQWSVVQHSCCQTGFIQAHLGTDNHHHLNLTPCSRLWILPALALKVNLSLESSFDTNDFQNKCPCWHGSPSGLNVDSFMCQKTS